MPVSEILQRMSTVVEPTESAELCKQALIQIRRDDDPVLWGRLQGELASSVAQFSGRQYTQQTFETVLNGYEAALSVFTPTEFPVGGQSVEHRDDACGRGRKRAR